jgi:hypothetical protein
MKLDDMKQYILFLAIIILQTLIYSCANVGYPTGGEVDKTPPKVLAFIPENESKNFGSNKVIIQFDEYIQLKDVDNQVLISPPFEQKAEIQAKGKFLHININDTLRPNTTYLFQFKNAVVDNNEGNPLPSLNYVFSTGNVLDSLSIKGRVLDAFTQKPDEGMYVFLYSHFSDSVVVNSKPVYVTKTDKDGRFEFKYIAQGKYKIIALKDDDKSLTYNNVSEKIAFSTDAVVPRYIADSCDTILDVKLNTFVQESGIQRITNSHMLKTSRAVIVTQRPLISPTINTFGTEIIKYINGTRDTLQIWTKQLSDSLTFVINDESGINDTLKLRHFQKKGRSSREPFMKTNVRTSFPYFDSIRIRFTNPVDSITNADELVYVKTDTDSFYTSLQFDSIMLNATLMLSLRPDTDYQIMIPGNRLTDIYGNKNDTINLKTKVDNSSDYGTIKLKLDSINDTLPYIVQILSEKDKVIAQKVAHKATAVFPNLTAGTYKVRIIKDLNCNGKWDPGNYWNNRQSEPVYFLPKTIELRNNWEIEETFSLAE